MDNKFLDPQTKQIIQDVVLSYKKKRDQALVELDMNEEAYKEQVSAIRKKVFDNFEKRLETAKANLQANGFITTEVKDSTAAREKIQEIIKDEKQVVKSKSNTGKEISLDTLLTEKGIHNSETDLGDYIVELFQEDDLHYVLPALHITPQMISAKIKEVFGDEVQPEPEKLTHYLCAKIRQNILKAEIGITGANFFTQTGQVVLLENEGNISLITRLPKKHIVVCGIDKLVESVEDATKLCQAAAIFGTGQKLTQYISVISGPSKTADIQNQLVMGAQGAKEVHVILIDNGRKGLLKTEFEEILRCINCGACINFCPAYHNLGKKYGGSYLGIKGLIYEAIMNNPTGSDSQPLESAQEKGSFECTMCGNCKENCPMKIELTTLLRKIRVWQNEKGIQTPANQEMLEKIKKYGNPFGEVSDKEIPDKLYCC